MNNVKKEKMEVIIKRAGFKNMRQFSEKLGINEANLYSNFRGNWGMSVHRMFKIANMLGCSIDTIIEIFYPEEYTKNKELLVAKLILMEELK